MTLYESKEYSTKSNPYIDITDETYHSDAACGRWIGSHQLQDYDHCPAWYQLGIDGLVPPKESPALIKGRVVHTLILEGDAKLREEYEISDGPINPKTGAAYGPTTKAYAEWQATLTRPTITSSLYNEASELQGAVLCHDEAAQLINAPGVVEKVLRFRFWDLNCQIKPDKMNPDEGWFLDLKTCENLDRFAYDVRDFGYIKQFAMYEYGLRNLYEKDFACYIVAVEKSAMHRVAVYKVTDHDLDFGFDWFSKTCHNMMDSFDRDNFPWGTEGIQERNFILDK